MTSEKEFFMRDIEDIEVDDAFFEDTRSRVEKGFWIHETAIDRKSIAFRVSPRYSNAESFGKVLKEFEGMNYYPFYRRVEDGLRISIVRKKLKKRGVKPHINALLLLTTAITTTLAGYFWWADGNIAQSIMFAFSLMVILGGHELGHALIARIRGIRATLPFFIPAPPNFPFGTFGAVIFMGSPVTNRKSLLNVGLAGPLAGFILSLPVLVIGLKLSRVIPVEALQEEGGLIFGMPLILQFLSWNTFGNIPPDSIVSPHPIAMAGWAGLFVTSLNLLPMGQLDGGHIIRGLATRRYKNVYYGVTGVLLALGIFWPGWLIWALLVWIMTRMEHPGPLDDVSELDRRSKMLALLALVIFVLCFMPVPVFTPEMLK